MPGKQIFEVKNMNYEELTLLMQQRHSCRHYSDKPLGRDKVLQMLEAARMAPSATNRQPWTFVVADSEASLGVVRSAYKREWFEKAPVVIVALGHHDEAWHRACDGKDSTDIDVAIAVEHMQLAATTMGLGTCWVCAFDPDVVREGFGLPADVEPIALIPVGYPADGETVPVKKRKPIEEIVKWGKY